MATRRVTSRSAARRTMTKQEGRQMTLLQARDEFIRYKTRVDGISEATERNYWYTLTRLANDLGNIKLSSLKPEHVEGWLTGDGGLTDVHITGTAHAYFLERDPVTPRTFNQYMVRLRVFFKWLHERGYISVNPVAHIKDKKVPEKVEKQRGVEILHNVLDHAKNPRDRIYVACAIHLAMRTRDLLALEVGHIDLDNREITVYINKSGKADYKPITKELDKELRRWFLYYASKIGRPLQSGDALFPHTTGSMFVAGAYVRAGKVVRPRSSTKLHPDRKLKVATEIVKHCLREAGFETRYEGTHTLRRAAARAYYEYMARKEQSDAIALRATQRFLNHAQSKTTEIYLGKEADQVLRDRSLKGMSFLNPDPDPDNVVPLRPAARGE